MATKLQELLEELKGLKEYFAQELLISNSTETVVLKEDIEELITKYTETTPTGEVGTYTDQEVEKLFDEYEDYCIDYSDGCGIDPVTWFNENKKEIKI